MLANIKLYDIIKRQFILFFLDKHIIIFIFYRQKTSSTMSNTSVHMVCSKSTPAAEESVTSENLSNYQELNFSLQENPYQSMSR